MRAVVATGAGVVAHDPQSLVDRVVGHRHIIVMGEQVAAAAGQRSQLGKDSERLARERHFVTIAHFHFLGGHQPYAVLLVKLGPLAASRNSPGRTIVKAISFSA
jgi:hypothetical protein